MPRATLWRDLHRVDVWELLVFPHGMVERDTRDWLEKRDGRDALKAEGFGTSSRACRVRLACLAHASRARGDRRLA
jgi:hypothetical protein